MYDILIHRLNMNREMKTIDKEDRHYVEVNGTYLVVPRSLMWYRHNTNTNMWSGEIIPRDKQVTWVQQDNGYFVEKIIDKNTHCE